MSHELECISGFVAVIEESLVNLLRGKQRRELKMSALYLVRGEVIKKAHIHSFFIEILSDGGRRNAFRKYKRVKNIL